MTKIPPGTKLFIKPDDMKENADFEELTSVFQADLPDSYILIDAPIRASALYPLSRNSVIHLALTDTKARYNFQGEVTDFLRKGEMVYLKVKVLTSIVRTQRRADFRLDVIMDASYITIEPEHPRGAPHEKCVTIDISGGGTAIRTKHQLLQNDIIEITMPIGDNNTPRALRAQVRWCRTDKNELSVYKYIAGLLFLFEGKLDKERMIKYIFRVQQTRLRSNR